MDTASPAVAYRFEGYVLDLARGALLTPAGKNPRSELFELSRRHGDNGRATVPTEPGSRTTSWTSCSSRFSPPIRPARVQALACRLPTTAKRHGGCNAVDRPGQRSRKQYVAPDPGYPMGPDGWSAVSAFGERRRPVERLGWVGVSHRQRVLATTACALVSALRLKSGAQARVGGLRTTDVVLAPTRKAVRQLQLRR